MAHYDKQEEEKISKSFLCPAPTYPFEIPPEMYHFVRVLEQDAKKHKGDNWLLPNGNKIDHTSNCASMFRHLLQLEAGETVDKETGLHPALHLACRALMLYTRWKRGLVHELDK